MTFNFALAEEAAQLVLNALSKLPFADVATLIQDLLQQANTQKAAHTATTEAPVSEPVAQ